MFKLEPNRSTVYRLLRGTSASAGRGIFNGSLDAIRRFLAAHDAFEVLAKCVNLANAAYKKENPRWAEGNCATYELIESAELEILQALALMEV